jgi:protein involved in polysaccharide export with SLBB domain
MKKKINNYSSLFTGLGLFLMLCLLFPVRHFAQNIPPAQSTSETVSPSSGRSCNEGEEVEKCIKRLKKKPRGMPQIKKKIIDPISGHAEEIGKETEGEQAEEIREPAEELRKQGKEGFVTRRRLPSDEQKASAFETYVRGLDFSEISMEISQFGYDLFDESPTTFAPAGVSSVGADYLLGSGDEILITLWGKINLDYTLLIDAEGKVAIPEIGVLRLSGLTLGEAKSVIEKELSRYYRASEIKMNISMGDLRSVRVFVVGKVLYPGSYTLSSFSTLINALFASGGPSKLGTMRDIQVKRNGETVTRFDLYDFLLKGDKTKDIRLQPEDVIFVPPVGPMAGIAGGVKNPAIYEMKGVTTPVDETALLDLIAMAGGLTSTAFKGRAQVQRVQDKQMITLLESDLASNNGFSMKDGDIVRIFPVIEKKDVVQVFGAVGNPGEFGVTPGVTKIKEVINHSGGLLYYALDEAELTRVSITQSGPVTKKIKLDLKKAMTDDPSSNILLESNDYILVKTIPEWQLYKTVEISGQVKFPEIYTIEKGETLSSLIERAGGVTSKAYLKGAVFTRVSVQALQKKQLTERVDRLEQQLLLGAGAALSSAVSGESAALEKAALDQRKELLAKLRAVLPVGRVSIEIDPIESLKGSPSDIVLEEGDSLFIPERPSSVQVMGSVYNQGSHLYSKELSIFDYIQKSGGMAKEADTDEIYVLKIDGTAISRRIESGSFFSGGFMGLNLDPGDTIVVPEEVNKIAWLREVKDFTQILYQIAVSAAVILQF